MEPHAQAERLAERANKQSRLHALEAKTKTPTQGMVLKHGGVTDAVTDARAERREKDGGFY